MKQRLNGAAKTRLTVLMAGSLMLLLGCEYQQSTAGTSGHDEAAPTLPLVIDAGVVIADRGGYLCLPLDRFSLKRDDHPIAVTSSCECIQPSLVTYATPGGSRELAVLLDHVDEPVRESEKANSLSSINLSVTITLSLLGGETRIYTCKMVRSALVASYTEENKT